MVRRCAPVIELEEIGDGQVGEGNGGQGRIAPPTPGFSVYLPVRVKVCRSVVIVRWSGVAMWSYPGLVESERLSGWSLDHPRGGY